MVEQSLPPTQSSPPPGNGTTPPPPPDGVWLTGEEWTEAADIDMAFFAAFRCSDVDDPHQLELLKSVQVRYAQLISRVSNRLHPDD